MMNIHFCSCNYDVGRTKLSTPLFYDWLFSSVLLLSCCAPNLLRLALFAIILPLLFPKLKSQHSASFILRTCWQPTANSSNIPVIYLWWNPLRSCARRQIVCHHHCLPIFHADRENRAERGQQTHGNARLEIDDAPPCITLYIYNNVQTHTRWENKHLFFFGFFEKKKWRISGKLFKFNFAWRERKKKTTSSYYYYLFLLPFDWQLYNSVFL
jgi:hypothetical protein